MLWQICAIGFVNGVAGAVFQPGVAGTVPRLASDVQGANGAIRVAESAAHFAARRSPVLWSGSPSPAGLAPPTYSCRPVNAVSALCLLLLRLPPPVPGARAAARRGAGAFRADLAEGWREFRGRRWLWGVIAVWCVYMTPLVGA
ncbi:hypothetical protein [Streptomyces sp. DHE17-7]|uniref:hypothetical protein n=1 Tax=Streptomyces sp. DHE17-7 TaxID=2759949 RepID=UPI003FA765F5